MQRSTLQRKVGLARTAWKKKAPKPRIRPAAQRKAPKGLWAQFGLTRPSYIRYKGLQGVYWHLFSRFIRIRDFYKYGGRCVDQCGGIAENWWDFQGGHFVPAAKGFTLLFDKKNVAGQLPSCNNPVFSPLSPVGFARELDVRYGKGTADELMQRANQKTKTWTKLEYVDKIRQLQAELVTLEQRRAS